jgi:hypothetical protein
LKRIFVMTVATLTALPAAAKAEPPKHHNERPPLVMGLEFYYALGSCETGKGYRDAEGRYFQPPRWDYNRNGYTGAFGVYKGTAKMFGYDALHTLSAYEQARAFDVIAFLGNEHSKPIGVNGWGCIRRHKKLQAMIKASKNPVTKGWKMT